MKSSISYTVVGIFISGVYYSFSSSFPKARKVSMFDSVFVDVETHGLVTINFKRFKIMITYLSKAITGLYPIIYS